MAGKYAAEAPQVDSGGYNFREKRDPSSSKTKLEHIRIEPSDNGGHMVTEHHVYVKPPRGAMGGGYIEPTKSTFGKDEHHKMLAHVAHCLGVNAKITPGAAAKEGSAAEEKGESKAEEASENEAGE